MTHIYSLAVIFVLAAVNGATPSALAADCQFPGQPSEAAIRFERYVGGFDMPVAMIFAPDRPGTAYVLEQHGLIKRIVGGVVQAGVSLDLSDVVDATGNETGLLGMAFHPAHASNRRLFINYTPKSPLRTRVSEFRMSANGTIDPSSERVVLEFPQPYVNHNGGDLKFGPDGYLYIGTGDGGSGGDPQGNGQNVRSLLGKMLRIDVDRTLPYAIPLDNPNLGANSRREIFAYGLRNPWRYSFDQVTGELWAADVGQNTVEEIDIIVKGANFGWNTMEGTRCFRTPGCSRSGLTLPVFEYPRSDGASITGGYVYRGSAVPSLVGAYVYADYVSEKVWALRRNGGSVANSLLADAGFAISSFAEDPSRELYAIDHGGVIYRILAATGNNTSAFPRTLSESGCFAGLNPLRPAAGVVPYEVNSELWSDGASKMRYVRVPSGAPGRLNGSGEIDLPDETVLLKNFFIPRRISGREEQHIVETRVLVKRNGGYRGYTYRWNDARTEAYLLGGATTRTVTMTGANGDETFLYHYPSTGECTRCHTASLGGALGFSVAQLNKSVGNVNQLSALANAGILDRSTLPADPGTLPRMANPRDTSSSLDARARSYLHVQCAMCHNANEPSNQGEFDMRFDLSFADTRLCDGAPRNGDLGVSGAKLIKPQDPNRSLVWLRTHSLNPMIRMPPLATTRLDPAGDQLLADWIRGITSCP